MAVKRSGHPGNSRRRATTAPETAVRDHRLPSGRSEPCTSRSSKDPTKWSRSPAMVATNGRGRSRLDLSPISTTRSRARTSAPTRSRRSPPARVRVAPRSTQRGPIAPPLAAASWSRRQPTRVVRGALRSKSAATRDMRSSRGWTLRRTVGRYRLPSPDRNQPEHIRHSKRVDRRVRSHQARRRRMVCAGQDLDSGLRSGRECAKQPPTTVLG